MKLADILLNALIIIAALLMAWSAGNMVRIFMNPIEPETKVGDCQTLKDDVLHAESIGDYMSAAIIIDTQYAAGCFTEYPELGERKQ